MKFIGIYLICLTLLVSSCGSPIKKYDDEETHDTSHVKTSAPGDESRANPIPDSIKSPNVVSVNGKRSGKWTVYFNSEWEETDDAFSIAYYRRIYYKNDKPEGIVRDYYVNGVVQWEGYLIYDRPDDSLDGECHWYYVNGKRQTDMTYRNGKQEGPATEYYDNGRKKVIMTYQKGKLEGDYIQYHENGQVKGRYKYVNDKLEGSQTNYHDNGALSVKMKYSNNKLSGAYEEYFKSGKVKYKGSYCDGNKCGSWFYYDENGDYYETKFVTQRTGAICKDGCTTNDTDDSACYRHGGLMQWIQDEMEITVRGTGKFKNYKKTVFGNGIEIEIE